MGTVCEIKSLRENQWKNASFYIRSLCEIIVIKYAVEGIFLEDG